MPSSRVAHPTTPCGCCLPGPHQTPLALTSRPGQNPPRRPRQRNPSPADGKAPVPGPPSPRSGSTGRRRLLVQTFGRSGIYPPVSGVAALEPRRRRTHAMELGILSLSDIQTNSQTGRPFPTVQRLDEIVGYATLADRLGLDVFALGEHHTLDFAVSSPAVVLAAVAARTERLRLASAVSVLSVLDPVRVYQDFATLDLLSHGRAEIVAGRSAFPEPFAIFGEPLEDYAALFAEKLELLLALREHDHVSWSGRFRSPLRDAPIAPRAYQQPLPVWAGVGGSPESAERAGRLGL